MVRPELDLGHGRRVRGKSYQHASADAALPGQGTGRNVDRPQKQQKELEKLYEKKMKERNKLEQYKYEKPKHEKYKSENRKNEKHKNEKRKK